MPGAPPLAASARSLLVAGLPTVSHPAERAAVITIKVATVTRTPRAPLKQPHRTEEYRSKAFRHVNLGSSCRAIQHRPCCHVLQELSRLPALRNRQ